MATEALMSVAQAGTGVLLGSGWTVISRMKIERPAVRAAASLGLIVLGRLAGVPGRSFRSGYEGVLVVTSLVDLLVPDRAYITLREG